MNLLNFHSCAISGLSAGIINRITLSASIELTGSEKKLLLSALVAVDAAIGEDPAVSPSSKVHILCLGSDQFSFSMSDHPDQLGSQMNLAILPVHRWRAFHLSDLSVLTCILEELCHAFWNTADEVLVQRLVLTAARKILPSVSETDLYTPRCP